MQIDVRDNQTCDAQPPQGATLSFHPLSDIFPLLQGAEFDELVADISATGLREVITLYEGMILDGRHRYLGCIAANVEPRFRQFEGDDPLAFVVSANLRRRHLNETQRAMVAAKLANMRQGERTDLSPIGERLVSQERAAELLNVGKRSVERAVEVRDSAIPELARKIERGEVSVSAAADVASLSKPEQEEIVARGEARILEAAKQIRARKMEIRRTERVKKIAAVSSSNTALPTGRRYPVILADPPWTYDVWSDLGTERAAENHYPTMKLDEICALPVQELATDDAILFLWTTVPHYFAAKDVLDSWGFTYKSQFAWKKDKIGCGYYTRNQHELLLIATKGTIPAPAPADRSSSLIEAPRGRHSEKPDEAAAIIERMYPNLPKIELFARERRPGWDCWGNEAPPAEPEPAESEEDEAAD